MTWLTTVARPYQHERAPAVAARAELRHDRHLEQVGHAVLLADARPTAKA
jgi:hypothetical protein